LTVIIMEDSFSKLGIAANVVKAMHEMGWTEPTPIQVAAVPAGLEGKDILGQAQTGTGKTGTYGAIVLGRIQARQPEAHALVLTPTRELALQVAEELTNLSKYTGHTCVPIYGGANMDRQTKALDAGADIIIATPGRLRDHMQARSGMLASVSIVILDESDRMLDMGFAKDLEYILSKVPKKRQTMLFSATMSPDIKKLALNHLVRPQEISVSSDEPVLDLITQNFIYVRKEDKLELLRYVLAKEPMKTIVFCHTKHKVNQVVKKLNCWFSMDGIQGNQSQNRREKSLDSFRNDEIQILVASDVAARGLDIENVMRVINMDMPLEAETYVHRIGRTGRAGKHGSALAFVMPEEKVILRDIERMTGVAVKEMPYPDGKDMETVFSAQVKHEPPVTEETPRKKNGQPAKQKAPFMASTGLSGENVILEINVGTADGLGKALVSKMFSDSTEVPNSAVGTIDPGERTTRVEIDRKFVKRAIAGLSKCTVKGRPVKADLAADQPKRQQSSVVAVSHEHRSPVRKRSESSASVKQRPKKDEPRLSSKAGRRHEEGQRNRNGDAGQHQRSKPHVQSSGRFSQGQPSAGRDRPARRY
jgi:ATP-dependent RNA helicase DeaD